MRPSSIPRRIACPLDFTAVHETMAIASVRLETDLDSAAAALAARAICVFENGCLQWADTIVRWSHWNHAAGDRLSMSGSKYDAPPDGVSILFESAYELMSGTPPHFRPEESGG